MNTTQFISLTPDEKVAHIDRLKEEWLAEIGKTPEDLIVDYEKTVDIVLTNE